MGASCSLWRCIISHACRPLSKKNAKYGESQEREAAREMYYVVINVVYRGEAIRVNCPAGSNTWTTLFVSNRRGVIASNNHASTSSCGLLNSPHRRRSEVE